MRTNASVSLVQTVRVLRKHILLLTSTALVALVAAITYAGVAAGDEAAGRNVTSVVLSFTLFCVVLFTTLLYYELRFTRRELLFQPSDRGLSLFVLTQLQHILDTRTGIGLFYSEKYLTGHANVDLVHTTEAYVAEVVWRTKLIFDYLTQDECSVCVKLFSHANDGYYPESVVLDDTIRDPSSDARRATDRHQTINIDENTAFRYICGDPGNRGFYFNNDLYRAYLGGSYTNSRESWFRYYNATAVMAIMNPGKSAKKEILGFLCVDNFRGAFDKGVTYRTLRILATCLYYVYKNMRLIEKMNLRPTGTMRRGWG